MFVIKLDASRSHKWDIHAFDGNEAFKGFMHSWVYSDSLTHSIPPTFQ